MVKSYVWCSDSLCQARSSGGTVIRGYYAEGEVVPGAPAQPYFYGVDQVGSVRRAFATTSSAPAYAYDPYGVSLQGTAPVTDFGYAGLFLNTDSGLYLTQYRAYDPATGNWLSRDPLGEASDSGANLYRYARGEPIAINDLSGLYTISLGASVSLITPVGGFTFGAGFYYTNHAANGGPDVGAYYTSGRGCGVDVGAGVQLGATRGALSNFQGGANNYNGGTRFGLGGSSNGSISGNVGVSPFVASAAITNTQTNTSGLVDQLLGPTESQIENAVANDPQQSLPQ